MMSLSSSQAGIVGARRKKLNQTQFSSYRYVKVEYNNPVSFVNTPPSAKYSFTARHIYSYNKNNNNFTLLGVQKAQSLKRYKDWISEITFVGSDPSSLNGTYIRSSIDSYVYWKNGMVDQEPYIYFAGGTSWNFSYNQGENAAILNIINDSFDFIEVSADVAALNYPTTTIEEYLLDNTTLNNINKHRLYTNTNADLTRDQLIPDVNFNINTANIFDTKNLANNQKVFVDVRWVKFRDEKRKAFDQDFPGPISMNNKKGNIYRAGIIIKDNTIDSMLYHTDLATDEALRDKMLNSKDLTLVL
jgi:hypothetical protein